VELLRSHGLDAYRVPLSGAATGFKSDVEVRLDTGVLRIESKVRSKGFGRFYKWLTEAHCLVIKADREQPLAVLSLETLCHLTARTHAKPIEKATGEGKSTLPDMPIERLQSIRHLPAFLTRSTKIRYL
jgi:hypothetical protein